MEWKICKIMKEQTAMYTINSITITRNYHRLNYRRSVQLALTTHK